MMSCHEHCPYDYCPECDEAAKDATIAKLEAEVDVANANLNTVRRQRRELEAVVDAAKAAVDECNRQAWNGDYIDALEQAIKEVEK